MVSPSSVQGTIATVIDRIEPDHPELSAQPKAVLIEFEGALDQGVKPMVLDLIGGKREFSHGWSLVQAWNEERFLVVFGQAKRAAPP